MTAGAAGGALVVLAAAALMAGSACGPGTEDDPVGAATRYWEGMRKDTARLRTARGADRDGPRRVVCYRLSTNVREELRRRAGGGGLPECPFIDRVALLNGSTRLGPLREPRVEEPNGGPAVAARFDAVRGRRREVLDVVIQEENPGNWQIVRLGDAGVSESEASR